MILAWQNNWDTATLTVGSQVVTLPGTNVQQPHISRKWHTLAGVSASHQVADMGSSKSNGLLSVLGTNLTSTTTYRVRASDVDPAAVATLLLDTGVLPAGVKDGYGAIYKTFAVTAARYWRVDVADASVPDNLQIGRIVVAPYWTHSATLMYGWGAQPVDPSTVTKSRGGQSYPDPLPKFRAIEFALDFLTEAEAYDNLFAMARAAGVVNDVLAIPMESSAYLSEQAVWGLPQVYEPVYHRLANVFRQKIRIEERL